MSISSIASLLPTPVVQAAQSAQTAQKPTAQNTAPQPVSGGDSDGDNDGSGGAINITPPVSIKA